MNGWILPMFAQIMVGSRTLNETIWLAIGFSGQALFTSRFLVQWVASEKKRDSVMPVAFWWLSLAGGTVLLCYAIHIKDPVIILGQSMGLVVYIRNLMLVAKGKRRAAKASRRADSLSTPHQRVDVPFAETEHLG